jgi:hypothetical protein
MLPRPVQERIPSEVTSGRRQQAERRNIKTEVRRGMLPEDGYSEEEIEEMGDLSTLTPEQFADLRRKPRNDGQ